MKGNNFKSALKVGVPKIVNSNLKKTSKTDLLLLKLGLFPMPENVQASISKDGNYLDLKLKDVSDQKHLLFQFPLEESDLYALKNRPDYHELIQRYYLYVNDYVDEIKKYAIQERKFLQERFPDLVFNIKIRIKSYDSYVNKLNENISRGKNPYINDIIAERIILSQIKENNEKNLEDEEELKKMCDKVAKALYDFRINTNFRMKKQVDHNHANSDKEYITKDYIKYPKENGYESIHILMENKNNRDFTYETQIRTLQMEAISKTSGEIAHNKYKPRLLNDLSPNRIPIYSEVSSFLDSSGNPIIFDIPLENRFYHFYNSEHSDHSNLKEKSNPITYSKFRDEQYKLESLLGIQFKQIREKLRNINLKDKSKQEER